MKLGVVQILRLHKLQKEKQLQKQRDILRQFKEKLSDTQSLSTESEYETTSESEVSTSTAEARGEGEDNGTDENLRRRLVEFYSIYNKSKLDEIDKILKHFGGRIDTLNEALMVTYGSSLDTLPVEGQNSSDQSKREKQKDTESTRKLSQASEDTELTCDESVMDIDENTLRRIDFHKTEVHSLKYNLGIIKMLYNAAMKEYFLPSSENFRFRYVSYSKDRTNPRKKETVTLLGMKDIWVDNISGTIQLDISSKQQSGTITPGFRLWTSKPISLKARIVGFKLIQNCHAKSPTVQIFETLLLEAEVRLDLFFCFNEKRGRWVKPHDYNQLAKVSKLSTHMLSITDQILKAVVNSILPTMVVRAVESQLPPELGKLLLRVRDAKKFQESKHYQDSKVCLELVLKVTAWPAIKDWDVDLLSREKNKDSSRRVRILKRLRTSEKELRILQRSLHTLSKSSLRMKQWNFKGPKQQLTLKALLQLNKLLSNDSINANRFRNSRNVRENFSKHKRLRNELQRLIDKESELAKHPSWKLAKLMESVGDILQKPFAIEVDIRDLDVCLNLDDLVLKTKSYLWRTAKAKYKLHSSGGNASKESEALSKELKKVHHIGNVLKLILQSFKAFSKAANLSVTGAFTGGKCPAYEFCIKDMDLTGITDIVLTNFRIGGQVPPLVNYIYKLLYHFTPKDSLKTNREASPVDIDLFQKIQKTIMQSLDLLQFFLVVSATCDEDMDSLLFAEPGNDSKREPDEEWMEQQSSVLVTLRGRRDDPRPPLSLHAHGSVVEMMELFEGESPSLPREREGSNSELFRAAPNLESLAEAKDSTIKDHGLAVYEKCMELIHNQGIIFPVNSAEFLEKLTERQKQSHIFFLASLLLTDHSVILPGANVSRILQQDFGIESRDKIPQSKFEDIILLSGELFCLSKISKESDPLLFPREKEHNGDESDDGDATDSDSGGVSETEK